MTENSSLGTKTVVLVHGGFVDGSGWEGVYNILRNDGYKVAIVQNPTISLAGDVAATKSVINAQSGPVILVGHSYGGVVITEAGNDPKVSGLVYIAAFAPDNGESVSSLIKNPAPDPVKRTPGGVSGILNFEVGDIMEWECEVDNTSDNVLTFRNEVYTGEMCNVFGSSVAPSTFWSGRGIKTPPAGQ